MITVSYKNFYIHTSDDTNKVRIQHITNYIYNQEHASLEAAKEWIRKFYDKVNSGVIERYQVINGRIYTSIVDLMGLGQVVLENGASLPDNITQAHLAEYFVKG